MEVFVEFSKKTLILIVDDDEVLGRAIGRIVERCCRLARRSEDVSIMKQTDPVRAVAVLKGVQRDYKAVMLITDGDMKSDLDGPDLAAEIAKIFEDRLKTKLLVTSDPDLYKDGIAKLGMEFLAKPFDAIVLTPHIERFLKLTE